MKPYWNCSNVSMTARFRLRGFLSTGNADFNDDRGSGRTPRNGAGSMATAAAARSMPANFWVIIPPKEWPTMTGFEDSRPMTSR